MSPYDRPDDQVIVLGGDVDPSPGETPDRPARSPLLVLAAVAAVFVGLIAFVLTPQEEAPTVVDPGDLSAPEEPAPSPSPSSAPDAVFESESIPQAAFGWQAVDLVGASRGITDIDHGPDGWLAVAEGANGLVAHTSPDAVSWTGRSLPDVGGYAALAAVGDGLMAVVASGCPADQGAPLATVSTDGGSTWTPTPVEVAGVCVVITALEDMGGMVYAAGAVGDNAFGVGSTRPGLWRFDGSSWVVVDSDTGSGSQFNDVVVAADGEVWVLGYSVSGPAVWRVDDERAVEVPVTLPEGVEGRVFIDVVDLGYRYLALMGARGPNTSGRHIVASENLVDWELVLDTNSDLVDIEAPGDGSLLGRRAEGGRLWAFAAGGEVVLPGFYRAPLSERVSLPYIGAVAVAKSVVVVGGSAESTATLLVRGVVGEPASRAAVAPEGVWETVAAIDVADARAEGWPFLVLSGGDDTLLVAPGQVLAVEDLGSGNVILKQALPDPTWAGVGPDGIWVTSAVPGSTRLYRYSSDGVWSSEQIPLTSVETIGRVAGRPVAFGWTAASYTALRQEEGGEWVTHSDDLAGLYGVVAVENGFLAWRERGGVVASADGLLWEPVEGDLQGGWGGTVPYLIGDRPGIVTPADRWPVLEDVELPSEYPQWVVRSGEDLWAADRLQMVVGNPSDGWTEIPLGLEHGIRGAVVPIPADVPTLAMMVEGEVSVLRWSDSSGS
jgi:hypothetical protein